MGIVLKGLYGDNLLGFMAALGTLRGLTWAWPWACVRLSWVKEDGAWKPEIHVDGTDLTPADVLDGLGEFMRWKPGHEMLSADRVGDDLIGKNTRLTPESFPALARATVKPDLWEREPADFLAAFTCGLPSRKRERSGQVQDTAFRTMSGAGNQHFVGTMRELTQKTARNHIDKSLFERWARDDRGLTLRWDPHDDRRYAYLFHDPTSRGLEARTEWGANRLAFEALPLFPVVPSSPGDSGTTGFSGPEITWPIWETPIPMDPVRSVLSLKELWGSSLDREALRRRGVVEVFRSRRISVGKYLVFTPAVPPDNGR